MSFQQRGIYSLGVKKGHAGPFTAVEWVWVQDSWLVNRGAEIGMAHISWSDRLQHFQFQHYLLEPVVSVCTLDTQGTPCFVGYKRGCGLGNGRKHIFLAANCAISNVVV